MPRLYNPLLRLWQRRLKPASLAGSKTCLVALQPPRQHRLHRLQRRPSLLPKPMTGAHATVPVVMAHGLTASAVRAIVVKVAAAKAAIAAVEDAVVGAVVANNVRVRANNVNVSMPKAAPWHLR